MALSSENTAGTQNKFTPSFVPGSERDRDEPPAGI
jgi:hypothetical protein